MSVPILRITKAIHILYGGQAIPVSSHNEPGCGGAVDAHQSGDNELILH